TGAAHGDLDVAQARHGLLSGELVGRRPARLATDDAELTLERELVHLHHDAVDVVVERVAALRPGLAERRDLIDGVEATGDRVRGEAELAQPRHRLGVGGRGARALDPAELVDEEVEAARGRDARIELAERAGGRVARIHVELLAAL